MTSLTRCTKAWIGLLLTTIAAQSQALSGCVHERTNYDGGVVRYNNKMNSNSEANFATCKSMCMGETSYSRNRHIKVPPGGKCQYFKWWNYRGGRCILYFNFDQTGAVFRGSPGNLYKLECKTLIPTSFPTAPTVSPTTSPTAPPTTASPTAAPTYGCVHERTNYVGNSRYDNTMNSNSKASFTTCLSMCKGETSYSRNRYNKIPPGGKCQYFKWMTWSGGSCWLYFNFDQARAYFKGSPGNLYKLACKTLIPTSFPTAPTASPITFPTASPTIFPTASPTTLLTASPTTAPTYGCVHERTNYDGSGRYDNIMNSNSKASFATCLSMCKGETSYSRNQYNKVPPGGKCQYFRWSSWGGGYCGLYFNFDQAHAYFKLSPGNLYKLACKTLIPTSFPTAPTALPTSSPTAPPTTASPTTSPTYGCVHERTNYLGSSFYY